MTVKEVLSQVRYDKATRKVTSLSTGREYTVEDFCWYYTDKVLYLLLKNNWHKICNVQYFKFILKED